MLVYAGIDEAGYGPLLGPLCVACTVFVDERHREEPIDDDSPCDLWKRLKSAVCRKRTDKRRRIAVDDSKKLKLPNDAADAARKNGAPSGAGIPIKHLERGVLSFCMSMSDGSTCPGCDNDLFTQLNVALSSAAWYGSSNPLPAAHTLDQLRISSSRLRKILASETIQCTLIACEAIDAGEFNRQYEQTHNKSTVNFCAVMRLIDSVWKRWPDQHPRIVVDRQGGRARYIEDLLQAYPDAQIRVLEENDSVSRYHLERHGCSLTIGFVVEAESAHLPVALASMTAKYVRELHMLRLNRYFSSLMPELRPTAGYFEDGRRYLAEIEPLIARMGVDRLALVRSA
jgi:ribonuclease HII